MAEPNGNEPHRNEPALLNIEDDMRQSYLDYAMSVNIGRALPQIRDGLKPVHRRILYAMFRTGLLSNRRYTKCAAVVGEEMTRRMLAMSEQAKPSKRSTSSSSGDMSRRLLKP